MEPIDLEVLDEAVRDTIVVSGLQFMRSITEAYGADHGMQLWDTISDTLGNNLKGEIFFRLLTGDGSTKITVLFSRSKPSNEFIAYIKAVRSYTGWGLKEAKDFCDLTESGKQMSMPVKLEKRAQCIDELKKLGVSVL